MKYLIHQSIGKWDYVEGTGDAKWVQIGTVCGLAYRVYLYSSTDWDAVTCKECLARRNTTTPIYMSGETMLLKAMQ